MTRQQEDLITCPCNYCVRRCDKMDHVVNCAPYQNWLTVRWEKREWAIMMAEVTRNAENVRIGDKEDG